MPYKSNADLPPGIKSLPVNAQSIWRNVFNSTHSSSGESSARKQAWGAVKNAGYKKDDSGKWIKMKKDKENVFKTECEVVKVDEELGIVFGWGMVTKVEGDDYFDTDNQKFTNSGMLKATTAFMTDSRVNNNDHTTNDVGTVIHSFPLTPEIAKSMGVVSNLHGWMVGVKPDKDTLAKFKNGDYNGFSIEGGAIFKDVEE